jgi:LuxR family maltose regulon positive regulatory protein
MSRLIIIQNQLLATKFFVPVASHPLIARPRLNALLQESLNHPLTIVSTPAGFGKTMLLASWGKSLSRSEALLGWLSLDEEDNEPVSFWINAITALSTHESELFTPLLKYLQSPQTPPLKHVLTGLINLLMDRPEHFVLILDDYHRITEPQVHDTLRYLVEHLPHQLHIILATRTDPPLSLSLLQTREQVLQIRTNQLACTVKETKAFLQEVTGIQLPDQTIQEITTRTEGWLVGLQLLGLSLSGCHNPAIILDELSGDQRYIQDFLIEEVLQRQSQEMQTFLLSTCILERFTASLCDAVMQQADSQRMLEQLERANLFVVPLDNKRQWYRYHALFAEALRYRLEHTHPDLAPTLHHRASLWYAEHKQTTQAILHAFSACQWQWAADLIEPLPVMSLTWGAGEHELVLLRHWLQKLPKDIIESRPRLCLACAQMLWTTASPTMVQNWLHIAETTLAASLTRHADEDVSDQLLSPQERQSQKNLLGEAIAFRAFLLSFQENGSTILALCRQASSLLSEGNALARVLLAFPQMMAYYTSANDTVTAIETVLHASKLAQEAGYTAPAIAALGPTVGYMTTAGQLGKAHQLAQEAIRLGTPSRGFVLPDVGWPMIWQAEILREWNQLDAARALVEEAIPLCQQAGSFVTSMYLVCGYATLAHICLSSGELDRARSALQEVERLGREMSQPIYHYFRSLYTTDDQVRLWLASKDLDRAALWVRERDLLGSHDTPFVHEREEVVRVRFLLATFEPAVALQRLEPVLERATTGRRWKHVFEVHLLQALAHQMCGQEEQALSALSEAVRLAEPEVYIRSFVNEGPPMAALLSQLREQQQKRGPTPYLDTVLAAFPPQGKTRKRQRKQDKVAMH